MPNKSSTSEISIQPYPYYIRAFEELKKGNPGDFITLLSLRKPIWPPPPLKSLPEKELIKEMNERRSFAEKIEKTLEQYGYTKSCLSAWFKELDTLSCSSKYFATLEAIIKEDINSFDSGILTSDLFDFLKSQSNNKITKSYKDLHFEKWEKAFGITQTGSPSKDEQFKSPDLEKDRIIKAIKSQDMVFLYNFNNKSLIDEECLFEALVQGEPVLSPFKTIFIDNNLWSNDLINDITVNNCTPTVLESYAIAAAKKGKLKSIVNIMECSHYFRNNKEILSKIYAIDNSIYLKLLKEAIDTRNPDLVQTIIDSGSINYIDDDSIYAMASSKPYEWFPILEKLISGLKYKPNLKLIGRIQDMYEMIEPNNPIFFDNLNKFGFEINHHLYTMQKRAERFGHTLGLSGNFSLDTGHTFMLEGQSMNVSVGFISEKISTYQKNYELNEDFKPILDAFNCSMLNSKAQIERYNQHKITHIPCGWKKHGVGVTIYNGYLIYCNRGQHMQGKFGTQIYKLKSEINEQWIRDLLANNNGTYERFNTLLCKVVDIENPITTFPSKPQKHGTCTHANNIAAIEGMLCLLEAERSKSGDEIATTEVTRIAKQMCETRNEGQYKKFTTFYRKEEVNFLIQCMQSDVKKDPVFKNFYYGLIKKIIVSHHGEFARTLYKVENEKQMARKLYAALPPDDQKKLFAEFNKDHQEIIKILNLEGQVPVEQATPEELESYAITAARNGNFKAIISIIQRSNYFRQNKEIFSKIYKIDKPIFLKLLKEAIDTRDADLVQAIIDTGSVKYVDDDSIIDLVISMPDQWFPILEKLISGLKYQPSLKLIARIQDIYERIKPNNSIFFDNLKKFGFEVNPSVCTMKNRAERFAQTLGLSGVLSLNKDLTFKLEEQNPEKSVGLISEKINSYQKVSEDNEDFTQILDAFNCTNLSPEEQMERYNQGKIIHIPCGEKGPGGITIYKGYLTYCNRGQKYGEEEFETQIYKLESIDEDLIRELLDSVDNQKMISRTLRDFAGIDSFPYDPIATFSSKPQKHPTSIHANNITAIEGMLCLLEADRSKSGDDIAPTEVTDIAKQMCEHRNEGQYKKFITFYRNEEVNFLIQCMRSDLEKEPMFKDFYYALIKKIILSPHEKDDPMLYTVENERQIARKLYDALPPDDQKKLFAEFAKDYPKIIKILNLDKKPEVQEPVKSATPSSPTSIPPLISRHQHLSIIDEPEKSKQETRRQPALVIKLPPESSIKKSPEASIEHVMTPKNRKK